MKAKSWLDDLLGATMQLCVTIPRDFAGRNMYAGC